MWFVGAWREICFVVDATSGTAPGVTGFPGSGNQTRRHTMLRKTLICGTFASLVLAGTAVAAPVVRSKAASRLRSSTFIERKVPPI